MTEGVINDPYLRSGIVFDAEKHEFRIDTQTPRVFVITAVNERTNEQKVYLLRVTSKGGLCLA